MHHTALADHAVIPPELLDGPWMKVITEKDAARMDRFPENVFALTIQLEDWPAGHTAQSCPNREFCDNNGLRG